MMQSLLNMADSSAYAAAKGGLVSLTRSMAGGPQVGPSGFVMGRDENRRFLGPHQQRQMLDFLCAGHRSPELGERSTAGSDEGSIYTIFPRKY